MKCAFRKMVLILFFSVFVVRSALAQDLPFPTKKQLAEAKAGELLLNPDSLKGYKADFGMLIVTESESKDSKKIELPVVRIHSKSRNPAYPVFYFEGGPGGTNIKLENLPDSLLENHDFVRVGYRGVDGSVSLNNPEFNRVLKETPNMLSHEGLKSMGSKIAQIAQKLQHEGIDLKEYNIINVVDDMEKARKAFGYEKINLSGGSYGGAVVYTYCIRYPASIHRALFTEAAFPFNMALTKPSSIDEKLNHLNELWKENPENLRRSKDIVETIKNVLKTLPRDCNGVIIDPDKIRIMTFFSLYTQAMTAQCFDAFIAAENGDYNGLAFVNQYWNSLVDWFNWGDMLSKTFCTDTGEIVDFENELNKKDSIIGSPLALLGWGLRQHTDWPVKPLPENYKKFRYIDNEALLVYGSKESAQSVIEEYMPFFKNGHIVFHENMGHMDVGALQAEASQHMEKMFFLKGIVDISKFQNTEVR